MYSCLYFCFLSVFVFVLYFLCLYLYLYLEKGSHPPWDDRWIFFSPHCSNINEGPKVICRSTLSQRRIESWHEAMKQKFLVYQVHLKFSTFETTYDLLRLLFLGVFEVFELLSFWPSLWKSDLPNLRLVAHFSKSCTNYNWHCKYFSLSSVSLTPKLNL